MDVVCCGLRQASEDQHLVRLLCMRKEVSDETGNQISLAWGIPDIIMSELEEKIWEKMGFFFGFFYA